MNAPSSPDPGIRVSDDGRAHLSGTSLQLFAAFERQFRQMALAVGATEHAFPALIDNRVLQHAGYFANFPNGATCVKTPVVGQECSLSPAVCYHCYPLLAESPCADKTVWTCQGRCFRHENGHYEGLARLWEFTMREIVFCGAEDWVQQQREEWMSRVLSFCHRHGLAGQLEESTDPFYGSASRGQQLLQRLMKLKYELRLSLADGTSTAAASFNRHGIHFTEAFDIRSKTAGKLHTGCIAFGLERWVLAALEQWNEAQQLDFINQTSKL